MVGGLRTMQTKKNMKTASNSIWLKQQLSVVTNGPHGERDGHGTCEIYATDSMESIDQTMLPTVGSTFEFGPTAQHV